MCVVRICFTFRRRFKLKCLPINLSFFWLTIFFDHYCTCTKLHREYSLSQQKTHISCLDYSIRIVLWPKYYFSIVQRESPQTRPIWINHSSYTSLLLSLSSFSVYSTNVCICVNSISIYSCDDTALENNCTLQFMVYCVSVPEKWWTKSLVELENVISYYCCCHA